MCLYKGYGLACGASWSSGIGTPVGAAFTAVTQCMGRAMAMLSLRPLSAWGKPWPCFFCGHSVHGTSHGHAFTAAAQCMGRAMVIVSLQPTQAWGELSMWPTRMHGASQGVHRTREHRRGSKPLSCWLWWMMAAWHTAVCRMQGRLSELVALRPNTNHGAGHFALVMRVR